MMKKGVDFGFVFAIFSLFFICSFVLSLSVVSASTYSMAGYTGQFYTDVNFKWSIRPGECITTTLPIYSVFEKLKFNPAFIETIINDWRAFSCGMISFREPTCPCSLNGTCDFCVYYDDGEGNNATFYNFGVKLKSNGSSSANLVARTPGDPYGLCYTVSSVAPGKEIPNCRGIIYETSICNSNQLCDGISFSDGSCAGTCTQKTCSQAGGFVCGSDEVCLSGELKGSSDSKCCSSSCVKKDAFALSKCSSCGDGFFNLCGRDECLSKSGEDNEGCEFTSSMLGGSCSNPQEYPITSCDWINSPGVYVLQNNISLNDAWIESGMGPYCFYLIANSGPIVLDLNGHSIFGNYSSDYGGIYATGKIAIKNSNPDKISKISGFDNSVDLVIDSSFSPATISLSNLFFEDYITSYSGDFSGKLSLTNVNFFGLNGGLDFEGGSSSKLDLDNVYFGESNSIINGFEEVRLLFTHSGNHGYLGANVSVNTTHFVLTNSLEGSSNSADFFDVYFNLGKTSSGLSRSIVNSFSIHVPDSSLVDAGLLNGFEFYLDSDVFPELNKNPVKIRSDFINISSNEQIHYFNETIENAFNINGTYDNSMGFGITYSPYFEITLPYFDYFTLEEKYNIEGYCFADSQCPQNTQCLNFKCTQE